MEFGAAKLDPPVSEKQSSDYWREKAKCLEEWVCELLRKNQTLRMDLENEKAQRQQGEGTSSFSLPYLYQSPFHADAPAFRTESPEFNLETGRASCPSKECAEIREAVIENAVMKESVADASSRTH